MNRGLTSTGEELSFLWNSVRFRGSLTCNGLVHDGPSHCLMEFLRKLMTVGKISSSFYLIFHLLPLILKIKGAKSVKKILRELPSTALNYIKSLLFMAFLVGLNRAGLCIRDHTYLLNEQVSLLVISPLSAASILFESPLRRNEITYYVCAKAIRSVFVGCKRVWGWEWGCEGQWMHVVLMGLLYYLYNHQQKCLKYRDLYRFVLGDS